MIPICVRCDRPTPDGYACHPCSRLAAAWLAEIADMTQAARDVAQRQARYGTGGGASGKPGSSLPIDLGATARLDAVQNQLSTWVRMIAEERGPAAEINPGASGGSTGGTGHPQADRDDLRASAEWLARHCEWMRHRPEVDEFLTDVEACARVIRGIARGPAAQRYLGPCGADRNAEFAEGLADMPRCEGDVYGPQGGQRGTCRTCGAQVDQAKRRAWLDDQVRDKAFRAAHIADAYRINVNTIRSWALERPEKRAENGVVIQQARPAKLQAHDYDLLGRPRYLLGDVFDLAAEAAARRAENEAKRAVRETAEMGA
ncbi:hypothetical protein [Actinoplanes palleronii]|uniref:Uncharacterized protein n=1 Tax=Actinoplanes palleronii TaxID=113570 RepID=A0ABQ4BKD1_9ACTN|nr:hypothetical protein [Actinoplanes palleronii]GIE70751.1 hypothetical protein Apa02nite_068590 [Actinoplanes palleronii]